MANEVRLINYDAAIDRYYAEYEKQDICDGADDRDWLKKCFDEAPAIDPESLRAKGRFKIEYHDEFDMLKRICSICGYVKWTDIHTSLDWNYCPNCGAKMMEG